MSEARYEPKASGDGSSSDPFGAERISKMTSSMDVWIQRVTFAALVALAAGLLATGIAFYLT